MLYVTWTRLRLSLHRLRTWTSSFMRNEYFHVHAYWHHQLRNHPWFSCIDHVFTCDTDWAIPEACSWKPAVGESWMAWMKPPSWCFLRAFRSSWACCGSSSGAAQDVWVCTLQYVYICECLVLIGRILCMHVNPCWCILVSSCVCVCVCMCVHLCKLQQMLTWAEYSSMLKNVHTTCMFKVLIYIYIYM